MIRCLLLMLPLCALISGCQTPTPQNACDGWQKLQSKPETAVYIIQNDRTLANGIASHNRFGQSQGCWD